MLSYTTSSSTPQVYLLRPVPTIAPSDSSLESAPPPCIAHRWGGRPPFPIWLHAVSWFTPLWVEAPRTPLHPLLGGTPTLCLPNVSPSTPWFAVLPGGETPPGPLVSPLSPPIYCYCTRAPTTPPPYTSLPGPAPLLLSFPSPLMPFPTASERSAGFGIPPPNCCYCRWLSVLGNRMPLTVAGPPHQSKTRPY